MNLLAVYVLVSACLGAGVWANPLQERYYDFDGNGVPDLCYQVCELDIRCMLADGSWTTVPSSVTMHTTTANSLSTTTASSTEGDATTRFPSTTSSSLSTSILWPNSTDLSISTSTVKAVARSSTTDDSSAISSSSSTTSTFTSSHTQQSRAVVGTSTSASNVVKPRRTGALPSPSQFSKDKGDKWTIEYVGNLSFTGQLQKKGLRGDNCRTGKVGNQVIWNCGDMMCGDDLKACGFSMGPAFYGTDDVMVVNTDGIVNVADNDFSRPWSGDKPPAPPFKSWGMYPSNVAPINSTHGVVYATEYWRNAPDGSTSGRGNTVSSVTLGKTRPIATRVGPLLTGPEGVSLGLVAILRDDKYIYIYSGGGPSKIIIGRVGASDDVFDASKYKFLKFGTDDTWLSGIPPADTVKVGATTANRGGQFACDVWGSVVYSNYLQKYIMLCGLNLEMVNMHISDTPWGPWSASYAIAGGGNLIGSYGAMMHPEYSPGGSDQSWYFSIGPNYGFRMFKVTFDY